jgi:hypothetical protein
MVLTLSRKSAVSTVLTELALLCLADPTLEISLASAALSSTLFL